MPVVVSRTLLQNTHKPLALLLQEDNVAERSPVMAVVTPVMLVCSTFQG